MFIVRSVRKLYHWKAPTNWFQKLCYWFAGAVGVLGNICNQLGLCLVDKNLSDKFSITFIIAEIYVYIQPSRQSQFNACSKNVGLSSIHLLKYLSWYHRTIGHSEQLILIIMLGQSGAQISYAMQVRTLGPSLSCAGCLFRMSEDCQQIRCTTWCAFNKVHEIRKITERKKF